MTRTLLSAVALATSACSAPDQSNFIADGDATALVGDAKPDADANGSSIIRKILQIEEQPHGSCAHVSAIDGGTSRRLVDSCHGWAVSGCTGLLFAHGRGVRVDSGAILFGDPAGRGSDPAQQIDARELVQAAVERARGSAFEHLHLRFGHAQCTRGGLEIAFDGSTIRRGAEGPAQHMQGKIVVDRGGRAAATLLAARPE